ncbi:MAG: ParB/RepB/Spo0J family partition protein [Rhodospirillaceae bacterium]|mgnify:FL=1|jgi:ParB family transcriptional regulator, chromosome partitioning protein|nr:ParB/RepB/Spo0J family partition protein [Rhodospirillaceae bacterium]
MVKNPSKKLGKGLSALLGGDSETATIAAAPATAGDQTAPIENVYPGRYQPRQLFSDPEIEELAGSIRELGILQPILVRAHPDHADGFEIIAGERRWRAAQLAQLHEVPILVREFSDVEALEIGLVENLQRENLSALEEAEGYRRLVDEFSHTQEVLAKILGKSRSHVANMMRLLNLPDKVKDLLQSGDLTAGHARALLNAEDPVGLAKKVIKRGLNVRQTEKLCQTTDTSVAKKPSAKPAKDANLVALEYDLSSLLGLKVEIDFKMSGGKVIISYETLEQLDGILHRLSDGKHGQSITSDTDEIPLEGEVEAAGLADLELTGGGNIIPDNVDDAIAQLEAGALLEDEDDDEDDDEEIVEIDLTGDFSLSDDDLNSLAEESE